MKIIVFALPLDERKDFIKEVIGLSGDKIEIKDKEKIYINGEEIIENYVIYTRTRI